MSAFLPYGRQSITDEDIRAVTGALQSDYLTCGPLIEQFEQRLADYVGAKHAIVVANATVALHFAMIIAKVGPGDRVITSPNTFLSSANCAAFTGATPDFCDIDPQTYNIDAQQLRENWKPDTKAVVAVAYAGQSCDMPAISAVAKENGAVVIEDGCHGTGGGFEYQGEHYMIGGHPWADITTFSFHPVKTLTTGEGGVLLTNHDGYAEEARLLRAHGVERRRDKFKGFGTSDPVLEERGPWVYEMQSLGYNGRITDLQCALGLTQLERLPQFITRRQEIVATYNSAFSALEFIQTPKLRNSKDQNITSWHLYTALFDFKNIGKSRSEVMACLREHGVGSQVLYIPVHLQPWYRENYGYSAGKCSNAEEYYRRCLSLPLYPAMTDADIDKVIQSVAQIVS